MPTGLVVDSLVKLGAGPVEIGREAQTGAVLSPGLPKARCDRTILNSRMSSYSETWESRRTHAGVDG